MGNSTIIREREKTTTLPDGTIETDKQVILIGNPKADRDFVKLFPAVFKSVTDDLCKDDGRLRLLWFFIAKVAKMKVNDYPVVIVTIEEMARALAVKPLSIKIYRKTLIQRGYIAYMKSSTGQKLVNCYVVNPDMVYKGYAVNAFDMQLPMFNQDQDLAE